VKPALKSLSARLLIVGLLAGSILAPAATASAAPCKPTSPFCGTSTLVGPDLSVGVSASPNPVAAGGTHTYVLSVTNMSWRTSAIMAPRPFPGADLSNVRVHLNAYPSTETLVSYTNTTNSGFTCYTPAEYFGMDVRCIGGFVPSLSTAQITLTMRAPTTPGAYTSTANVDPYNEIVESNESNNTASVSFTAN
jgi:hypothetical protein